MWKFSHTQNGRRENRTLSAQQPPSAPASCCLSCFTTDSCLELKWQRAPAFLPHQLHGDPPNSFHRLLRISWWSHPLSYLTCAVVHTGVSSHSLHQRGTPWPRDLGAVSRHVCGATSRKMIAVQRPCDLIRWTSLKRSLADFYSPSPHQHGVQRFCLSLPIR